MQVFAINIIVPVLKVSCCCFVGGLCAFRVKNMPRNKLMKEFSWALDLTEFNLNNHSDFANNNNNSNNSNNVMPILDTSSIWFTSLSSCVAFFLACGFTGFFLACLLGLAFFPFFLFFCQTFWLLACGEPYHR